MVHTDDSSNASTGLSTSRHWNPRRASVPDPRSGHPNNVNYHASMAPLLHTFASTHPSGSLISGLIVLGVIAVLGTILLFGLFTDTLIAWGTSARRDRIQEPPPANLNHRARAAAAFTGLAGCAALAVFSLSTSVGYHRAADSYHLAVTDVVNVLANPAVPSTALDAAAVSPEPQMRIEAAQHSTTTPISVAALAADSDPAVRAAVARRSELPERIITQQAADPDPVVRLIIAQRSDTPPSVLAALALDSDPAVRAAVARRSELPERIITQQAADPDPVVRLIIAQRSDTPPSVLAALALDSDSDVRAAAVANPNIPPSGLEASLRDAFSVIDPAPAQR